MAIWSLSHVASGWSTGACPPPLPGSPPCVETNGPFHFNGNASGANVWHGHPGVPDDFEFSGPIQLECNALNLYCNLMLGMKIKKCQDSNGDWRIGMQVNTYSLTGGFLCGTIALGGFPWYFKDPAIASHCPFIDDCDNFIPFIRGATKLVGNLGNVDINALGSALITDGHLHNVVFTQGTGAHFSFNSDFFSCGGGNLECNLNGVLLIGNAFYLDIH